MKTSTLSKVVVGAFVSLFIVMCSYGVALANQHQGRYGVHCSQYEDWKE